MTKAKRYNSGKVEFDDIPIIALVEIAKVAKYGQSKYGKNNWRNEASLSQYLNCALRHILKRLYGEYRDSESGCLHLAHAGWNILAAIEKYLFNKEIDDCFSYASEVSVESLFKTNNGFDIQKAMEESKDILDALHEQEELEHLIKKAKCNDMEKLIEECKEEEKRTLPTKPLNCE